MARSKWRALRIAAGGVVGLAALGAYLAHHHLSGSLPRLDGELSLPGLEAEVTVERDGNGVPTIRGASRLDVARALGFLHAQERYFQMDLMRRRAAGELAELVGEGALELDRYHRIHRMRERARRVVAAASPEERLQLSAYVEGINEGLEALSSSPFEYALLRSDPKRWEPEDSVLVVMSMFFELNDDNGSLESAMGLAHDLLPRELADFLAPPGGEWDAPVSGEPFVTPPIPGPDVIDLRKQGAPPSTSAFVTGVDGEEVERRDLGSNNWAVAGSRSRDGRALLANDMHLAHAVPNIWYRAVLSFGEGPSQSRLAGVTLPGAPTLVAGTNGAIAWGFTNTGGDFVDLVELEIDPDDPTRYRTPDGFRSFEVHRESIAVHGRAPETLDVRETIWGPVIDEDHDRRPRAVRWIAHDVEGVNLKLGLMENARSLEEALRIAPTVGIPPQNFVCAASDGRIGWTVAGRIPKRIGFDGSVPGSWANGERTWDGFLAPEDYPVILDPASGLIWTANARVVSGEMLAKMGDGGYALGARAKQIRDDLRALDRPSEKELLAIQLDDRAVFLERWRNLFLDLARNRPELADVARALSQSWTGRASIDSSGYRVVKELRLAVFESVFGALTAKLREADPRFRAGALRQWEGPLWKLVSERPAHLVPPPFASWEEALVGTMETTLASWPRPLESRTWGARNTSAIRHPLSRAMTFLSRYLDMPARELPGDTDMPRVQGPSHGASERLVVSPGHEEDALFHMPGGQSGHPLSPYYGAGHEDWEEGRPTPLLPGSTVHRLTLHPAPER
jgi:penicillin G amidase